MQNFVKRSTTFLLFVLLFASFFSPVSAQVVVPDCNSFQVTPTSLSSSDTSISVTFNPSTGLKDNKYYEIRSTGSGGKNASDPFNKNSESFSVSLDFSFDEVKTSPLTVYLNDVDGGQQFCETNLIYDQEAGIVRVGDPGTGVPPTTFDLCQQAGANRNTCDTCLANSQIWTGVGCIPFGTQTNTVRALITIGLSITGTVVVMMTLYSGFMFSTSQGDPKRVDEAKGAMTSAIIGALFIIFSVTMLRFIGVTILQIPGFG